MPGDLCKHIGVLSARLCVFALLFAVVAGVEAQTVKLKATVSETVTLSVAPNSTDGNFGVDVVSSGNSVRLALSGSGDKIIRVPLIVRSNTSFRISGSFESATAKLTQLSVLDVRAMGRLVAPEAVDRVEVSPRFDLRGQGRIVSTESLDVLTPFFVVSGPRISLGGTLASPNNALQVTMLIRVRSKSVGDWLAHLTFFND